MLGSMILVGGIGDTGVDTLDVLLQLASINNKVNNIVFLFIFVIFLLTGKYYFTLIINKLYIPKENYGKI